MSLQGRCFEICTQLQLLPLLKGHSLVHKESVCIVHTHHLAPNRGRACCEPPSAALSLASALGSCMWQCHCFTQAC
jgi:hypothetical protein